MKPLCRRDHVVGPEVQDRGCHPGIARGLRRRDGPSGDVRDLRVSARPRERQSVLEPLAKAVHGKTLQRDDPVARRIEALRKGGQEVLLEEDGHQVERQQRPEDIDRLSGLGRHFVGDTVRLTQSKLRLQRPQPGQSVGLGAFRSTDPPGGGIGRDLLDVGVEGAMEPVAMQALELQSVTLPLRPRRRIDLHDLEPIAPSLEPNAVVVAERVGGPGDELVQLDLRVHQRVKDAQIP